MAKSEHRFDHVATIVKLDDKKLRGDPTLSKRIPHPSPTGTYILDTNFTGPAIYSAEERLARTSANEVSLGRLNLHGEEGDAKRQKMASGVTELLDVPYTSNPLLFIPTLFNPPDKLDRISAARRIQDLSNEIDSLMAREGLQPSAAILARYREAQTFLLDTYFPYIRKDVALKDRICQLHTADAFQVDGINSSNSMVCSEFISNLWMKAGIITGYVPASSQRPFDFLNPDRFCFTNVDDGISAPTLLKLRKRVPHLKPEESSLPLPHVASSRLTFLNKVLGRSSSDAYKDLGAVAAACPPVSPAWLVDRTASTQTKDLPFRLFCSATLFSFISLASAPLSIKWVESQAGSLMVRGGMWSLSCGLLVRNVTFAAVQSATAWWMLQAMHPGPADAMLPQPMWWGSRQNWVDARHPFYGITTALLSSAAISHVLCTPLSNATTIRHFVKQNPGPVPMRLYFRGALSLLPFSMLVPFPCYWLLWYETVGRMVLPPSTPILTRAHATSESAPGNAFIPVCTKTVLAAFVATLFLDSISYPIETLVRRRMIRSASLPTSAPRCYARRRYAGFRHRLACNAVTIAVTSYVYFG